MHIVVLVDSYYPNFTMNGIIARNIIENLAITEEISVITYKNSYEDANEVMFDDVSIYRTTNHNICISNFIKKKLNQSPLFYKKIYVFFDFIRKIFFYTKKNIRILGLDKSVIKSIVRKLNILNNQKAINVVITISAPFELTFGALEFTKSNSEISLVPIQLDFFSVLNDKFYPTFLKDLRKRKRAEFEHLLIEESKVFFALEFLRKTYFARDNITNIKKIIFIEHPLIKKNNFIFTKSNLSSNEETSLVYAGSLSKYDRSPVDVLEILLLISNDFKYRFNIFHRGDCDEVINNYKFKMSNKLKNWGSVDSDVSYGAINTSDFLFSIGTKAGNQIAGKTFDYISTGKPIIYFYYSDNDINLDYFNRYPIALCLNISKLSYQQAARQLENFLTNFKGKSISFDKIEKWYNLATPTYISSLIFEKIFTEVEIENYSK